MVCIKEEDEEKKEKKGGEKRGNIKKQKGIKKEKTRTYTQTFLHYQPIENDKSDNERVIGFLIEL